MAGNALPGTPQTAVILPVTIRVDALNLFPETRWLNGTSSVVNLTTPQTLGKFPAADGYSFSNWYTPNGSLIGVLRLQF